MPVRSSFGCLAVGRAFRLLPRLFEEELLFWPKLTNVNETIVASVRNTRLVPSERAFVEMEFKSDITAELTRPRGSGHLELEKHHEKHAPARLASNDLLGCAE